MNFLGIFKPTKGYIIYNDTILKYDKKTLTSLRMDVGIVFQDPDKQILGNKI